MWLQNGAILDIGDSRVALVSRDDVAGAAAGILLGQNHLGAIYNATGPVALSGEERAKLIAHIAGKSIQFHIIPVEQLRERYLAVGFPEEYIGMVVDTKKKCVTGGFDVVTGDVQQLSGQPPRSFSDVLIQHLLH